MCTRALLTCICLASLCSASSPGIYVDNGLDQTVMDRAISARERREMESEILDLLGLPRRPKAVHDPAFNRSAPKFLMDVYRTLASEEDASRGRRDVGGLNGDEMHAIDESDVIMTFESKSHHLNDLRHGKGKKLWFDVTKIPTAEDVVGAELRIFKISNDTDPSDYSVTVYEILQRESGNLRYLSAVNTTGGFSGWLTFNLTGCLATWVAFPDSNLGLYLSARSVRLDKPGGHDVRPREMGLVDVKNAESQPFLVAFLKGTNNVKIRPKRNVNKRVKKANYVNLMRNSVNRDFFIIDDRKSCRIQTLYISFRDLKWQDWIIAPEGYAAYFCSGECNFPLNGNMNATNHAIVQTLVHLMKPLKYPKPCCAPTKLTPISVLYFLDDTNVVLKKYKKMVVKSCGCH